MVAEDDVDPPTFVIRTADGGESFEFKPPADLWLDMLAYSAAFAEPLPSIIVDALESFLTEEKNFPHEVT